ncbi:hypothetical protein [Mycolicibacterium austroafricanum]|nr:hypothetical protein [Mycolicibacterium austroafricanum]
MDDMFAAAKTSVKAPPPVHDESMDGQLHELAKTSREQALDG